MKSYFYLLLLLGVTSLAQKNKVVYAYENTKTLIDFLDENKVNYNLKDLAVFYGARNWLDFYNEKRTIVPSAYFYNAEGLLIVEDFDADRCGQVISGLDSKDIINSYKTDPEKSINSFLERIDFKFTQDEIFNEKFDLYVVIVYGKLVKTKTSNPTAFNWYNRLKTNTNVKIKPILLSIDIMDDWKVTPEFEKEFDLNKKG